MPKIEVCDRPCHYSTKHTSNSSTSTTRKPSSSAPENTAQSQVALPIKFTLKTPDWYCPNYVRNHKRVHGKVLFCAQDQQNLVSNVTILFSVSTPLLIYSDMRLAHAVDGLELSTDISCRNFWDFYPSFKSG